MTAARATGPLKVRATVLPWQVLPADPDWTTFVLVTGRGGGKSHTLSRWVVRNALRYPNTQWAAVGRTWSEVRRVLALGPSGIRAFILSHGLERMLKGGKWEKAFNSSPGSMALDFANGSSILFCSADRPDSVRGLSVSGLVGDEVAFWPEETWKVLAPAIRERLPDGTPPRKVLATTPNGENWFWETFYKGALAGVPDERIRFAGGGGKRGEVPPDTPPSTFDNPFTDSTFKDDLRATYDGTTMGQQELRASFLSAVGSIFTVSPLKHTRAGVTGDPDGETFDPNLVWPEGPDDCVEVWAGQDLGTVHPSALIVFARVGERICIVDEVVAAAATEDDWSAMIAPTLEKWKPHTIWSDRNFPQTTEAQRRRYRESGGPKVIDVQKGAGSVEEGIRDCQRHLATGLVIDVDACPVLWRELRGYRWATDAKGNSLERPLKELDDTVDAWRYGIVGPRQRPVKRMRVVG